MNRLLTVFLLFFLIISFTSCFFSNVASPAISECSHVWSDATCTDSKTCYLCKETQGEPLGHTCKTGICDRCEEAIGTTWILKYYVDEFQQPTNQAYVTNYQLCTGVFSNSATSNSTLTAYFLIDRDDVSIALFEYGSYRVKNIFDKYQSFPIIMKDTSGNKHDLLGTMYGNGDRIFINDEYKNSVLDALSTDGEVQFYIVDDNYGYSTYSFTVKTENFKDTYNSLF